MAAIVWNDVLAVAPELSSVANAWQTRILARVNGHGIDPDVFDGEAGSDTAMARCLLAAHMAVFAGLGNAAGPITAETEGGISRSYASSSDTSSYSETAYGRQFSLLCKMNAGGVWLL